MRTYEVTAETYRGWTKFGLSLNGSSPAGEASVHGSNAVTDPFNERRVVAQGLIQAYDETTSIWTDYPAVVSWDVGDAGTPAVGGPVDVAAQSNDGKVIVNQVGPPQLVTGTGGRITYNVTLSITQL